MTIATGLLAAALLATTCDNLPKWLPDPAADPGEALPEVLTELLAEDCSATIRYVVATYLLRQGQDHRAVRWLSDLAQVGWALGVDADIAATSPAFEVVSALNRAVIRRPQGTPYRRFSREDLFPEGIAYDLRTDRLFLGSLMHNQIAVKGPHRSDEYWDLPPATAATAVLGIQFDTATSTLWVLRNHGPDRPSDLLILAGDDGEVRRTIRANPDLGAEVNDLCLIDDQAFITDGRNHQVLIARPDDEQMTATFANLPLKYPNGIACSVENGVVFVADIFGILQVDVASGRHTRLPVPAGQSLGGIDGLVWANGQLIGVQNAIGRPRVVSVDWPNSDGSSTITVLDSDNLHYDIPTTLVAADRNVYVIANSQLDKMEAYRETPSAVREQLVAPVVLRLALER